MLTKKLTMLAAGAGLLAGSAFGAPPPGHRLVWSEDFNRAVGAPPDPARWGYDLGAGGWGNNELETYTNAPENARIVADPFATDGRALAITAVEDGNGGYTSARILTKNKAVFQYGYIEARLQLPHGQGIWPAFWMLGEDIDQVGWPACGEIDIMENIGKEPTRVHGSLHGPAYSGGNSRTGAFELADGEPFNRRYHLFAVDWHGESITFYVDGKAYRTFTPADIPNGAWTFDKPFFIILNVAVGGNWPGAPDKTSVFPQAMKVDYVRVYRSVPARKDAPRT
jgi:beta-glucanase (GH16 family)